MNIAELKKQFIVDEDVLRSQLKSLVTKALKYCRTDQNGQVLILPSTLPGRDQVKLVLAARAIAAELDETIRREVTVAEIQKYTGLPGNQVRARGKEAIEEKFAEAAGKGIYRAVKYKIEGFLDGLTTTVPVKTPEK